MRDLVLVVHNLRSAHNVGALLRTCEGLGVKHVFLTGYTPYPTHPNDTRLPHVAQRVERQIAKTALGAESSLAWSYIQEISNVIMRLRKEGYAVMALEQAPKALSLPEYEPDPKTALIVGREVQGIEPEVIAACDGVIEIPMFGRKESYNVSAAAAMALYHLRFFGR